MAHNDFYFCILCDSEVLKRERYNHPCTFDLKAHNLLMHLLRVSGGHRVEEEALKCNNLSELRLLHLKQHTLRNVSLSYYNGGCVIMHL